MQSERIPSKFQDLIMSADEAAKFIRSGMVIGTSGFGTGYPKAIPTALAESGHAKDLTILNGAARGKTHIEAMASAGILSRGYGFQYGDAVRGAINSGEIAYCDVHLGQFADKIKRGTYGHVDAAIVECCKIREDGGLVPTMSAGIVDTLVELADIILVEINEDLPVDIEGFHDFGAPKGEIIKTPSQRMGIDYLKIDPKKIKAIVMTNAPDTDLYYPEATELYDKLSANVIGFLKKEIAAGGIPEKFTLQSGTGVVANLVLVGLVGQGFKGLKMFTEVVSDQALFACREGIIDEVTSTTLDITPIGFEDLLSNLDFFKQRLVLRPISVTNNATQILAQELVSLNTAWEVDIYGNINSSHAMGVQMINGLGGSNDFARNAKLTVFTTPSTAKGDTISRIVPMVPHVDSTEHDVDVIVTECGYADLRGLSPKERAKAIIENCAHPLYRPQLRKYFDDAVDLCGPCQTPHDLNQSLSWYYRYLENGTMLEQTEDAHDSADADVQQNLRSFSPSLYKTGKETD